MLNRLQVQWLCDFVASLCLMTMLVLLSRELGGNCRNWGIARETNCSVQMEVGSVVECTLLCYRGLTATRSGEHQSTAQQETDACFGVKISGLKPWYWLAVWCRTKPSESLSSFSPSSKRGSIISFACVKSFLGPPKMTSTRALWMTWTSLVAFQETKARDLSAWWPFQEESIATPPLFSCWGRGSIAAKLNKQTKR